MKLHYMGKFDLDPDSLPHGEHKPNAVQFKEAKDSKQMSVIANVLSIAVMLIFLIPVFFVGMGRMEYVTFWELMLALVLPMLTLFPHELLHALCFKKDVYFYTNLKQGMLFVVGPETMTKGCFVFMSLLPSIIFGAIPYTMGLLVPRLTAFAVFGAMSMSMGAGDFYNVFNAMAQMPKGARTYLYKFNSFWYMPKDENDI